MRAALASCLLLLTGLSMAATPATTDSLDQLRAEARQLAAGHCGECHSSKGDHPMPKALRVFDTEKANWSAGLSEEKLHNFLSRFKSFKNVSPAEVERISAFVDAELAARQPK